MLIYDGVKADFMKDVESDSIADILEENISKKMRRHTGLAEYKSWINSLEFMYMVMNDDEIPEDCGVAIEYNIPQTDKRVDFLISGYDGHNAANMDIVELKQWDKIKAVEGLNSTVSTYTGGAERQVVHPSYQAWSYASFIRDYNQTVQDEDIQISSCAYMHNYQRKENDPLDEEQYQVYEKESPAFTKGQVKDLRKFIKDRVVMGDQKEIIYKVENGKIRPSKSLQDSIGSMLKGNQEFVLLDEQRVVYEKILMEARKSKEDEKKRVIIVQGGPGTGKSVIAVNLLAELTQEGQYCNYVSKNSAPRNVYLKKLKGDKKISGVDNLFKGSSVYKDMDENLVDTLIADEAHRLNGKTRFGCVNQIKEIIHAAKCSVFFIDEDQRVTMEDIGSVDEIRKWAKEAGAEVSEMGLVSQFRCNGSDGYLAWLDNTLEIHETANRDLRGIDYDIRIMDTPQEVYDQILQKNEESGNRARMLAGYCWDWDKKNANNSEVHDIQIGDFGMSWNLGNTSTYAIDEDSVHEIGCIHTAQGLEFDYVGVIIGDDLRYENGHIVTDYNKRANTDHSLNGIKKMSKEDPERACKLADTIIKNTYKTLMTRGMKGCYIYCTDKNLAEYLRECMKTESDN